MCLLDGPIVTPYAIEPSLGRSRMQVLVFEIDATRYGLPVDRVREIVRAVAVTPMPHAPRVIDGVINFRGELAAVLNLRARFGLPEQPVRPEEHFILADATATATASASASASASVSASAANRLLALRADRVTGLVTVPPEDIVAPDRVTARSAHLSGVARLPDGVVLIHDLDTFLSEAEAMELDRALAGSEG